MALQYRELDAKEEAELDYLLKLNLAVSRLKILRSRVKNNPNEYSNDIIKGLDDVLKLIQESKASEAAYALESLKPALRNYEEFSYEFAFAIEVPLTDAAKYDEIYPNYFSDDTENEA